MRHASFEPHGTGYVVSILFYLDRFRNDIAHVGELCNRSEKGQRAIRSIEQLGLQIGLEFSVVPYEL